MRKIEVGFLAVFLALTVLLCISTASAKKERRWQTGKLLDMKGVYASFLGGDVIVTVGSARSRINETYLIDAGEYIYASQEVRRSKDKTPPLTVNGPVQFAIEKEHEPAVSLAILKRKSMAERGVIADALWARDSLARVGSPLQVTGSKAFKFLAPNTLNHQAFGAVVKRINRQSQ